MPMPRIAASAASESRGSRVGGTPDCRRSAANSCGALPEERHESSPNEDNALSAQIAQAAFGDMQTFFCVAPLGSHQYIILAEI